MRDWQGQVVDKEIERERCEFLATIDDARDSIRRGEGLEITAESMEDMAAQVKLRGRARLAAKGGKS